MSKFRRGHITRAKLTPQQVLEMRNRGASGETHGSLSRAFGIGIGQVGRILRGEAWQEYQQPETESEQLHQQAVGTIAVSQYNEQASLEKLSKLLDEAQKLKDADSNADAALNELKNPYY